jgi:hypothetical protein
MRQLLVRICDRYQCLDLAVHTSDRIVDDLLVRMETAADGNVQIAEL